MEKQFTRRARTASSSFRSSISSAVKTVEENIVFALTAAGKHRRPEAMERARFFLNKVNLSKFAAAIRIHSREE
jgi:ABC-type nitrate/sulfonate/bicarbonate transport system ATPase subunit